MEKSELIKLILENTNNYYNGKSCVPDNVFDGWIEELRKIDPDNHILHSVGWGYDMSTCSLTVHPHLTSMIGISDKRKVGKDDKLEGGKVKTPKLDGGSVELQYVSGQLIRALTRGGGDGSTGFDCTAKLMHAQGVATVMKSQFTGNVIGEFLISDEDLPTFSESTSQRNVPNGFLSREYASPEDCAKFSFVAYKIGMSDTHKFVNRVHILDFLGNEGFLTSGYVIEPITQGEALESLRVIGGKHYLLDGIVVDPLGIRTDENGFIDYQEEYCCKSITETAMPKVTEMRWRLTRTRKLIPTVLTGKVKLSGASVSRYLGHNAKYILESGIGVGAVLETVRSGEVIPYILGVVEPVEVKLPTECPDCHSPLEWSGVHLVCNNENCNGQGYANLYHWLSNLGSVDNLGGSLISAAIEGLEITEISDFYDEYDLSILLDMDGIGQSKIATLDSALRRLKEPHTLQNYLVAFNIPGLSWESAGKVIAGTSIKSEIEQDFYSDEFEAELCNLKGVNWNTKVALLKNWGRIMDLKKFMVLEEPVAQPVRETDATRIKVCITGKLTSGTKAEFFARYDKLIVESNVKECECLVCNEDKDSSKMKTAKKLGKAVMTEAAMVELIERGLSHDS